jgi:hypothetical protein
VSDLIYIFYFKDVLFRDEDLLRSKGTSAQMQERINGEQYSKSSHLTAIKRLADYCKQFPVTADIVMETNELINTHPDKQY